MAEIETLLQLAHRPPRRTPRDDDWEEVKEINSYAVFMGYLSMAIRGVGILVVTWTTVVLLGGFVSKLNSDDFWCITVITFMQAAGVFDLSRSKRLSSIWDSVFGMLSIWTGGENTSGGLWSFVCAVPIFALVITEALVYIIVLLPIFALYISGPYVPIWLAVWRMKHLGYYGNINGDDNKTNLKKALDVLYALVIAQGVLIYYRTIYALAVGRIVKKVVTKYEFKKWASTSVWGYLKETRIGCSKDPSFTRRRNLITYAADLIKSESADRKLSGARILDTLIQLQKPGNSIELREREMLMGQHMLMQQLIIGSADVVMKLLHMLSSRCPYDREMRKRAARIVAHLAGSIHLKQFPGGIECIASLLGSFDEHLPLEPYQRGWLLDVYEQDHWCGCPQAARLPPSVTSGLEEDGIAPIDGYKELVQQGLTILWKLAAAEDNCMIMGSTRGLLNKVMGPLNSDLLHRIDHGEWPLSVVEGSLRVVCQFLMVPAGETSNRLRCEISRNEEAIRTMEGILRCDRCGPNLKKQVIRILTHLSMGTSRMSTANKENFTQVLVHMFTNHENSDGSIAELAGEALARLSLESQIGATSILKTEEGNGIIGYLMNASLQTVMNNPLRRSAAEILENLCVHCTMDDGYLEELKRLITHAIPQLLQEILHRNWIPMAQEMELCVIAALLSLCVTACDRFELQLEAIGNSIGDGTISFPLRLKRMVDGNNHGTPVCLMIVKLTARMITTMIKDRCSYTAIDMGSLIDSLSTASVTMLDLESSMVFAKGDHVTNIIRPGNSFVSLVKEARELLNQVIVV
ncbi:uncharacterized protein C2845_PM05G15530 [Panicum miliaceum]|uniref:Uncharacterized protein n=1 Tax=Panicum miliaceum TaxID=4540 RepID=A0A3L6T235_PANMI|nr:uncharacterized protein C2845_PM05G15530 [Panicum miliaceum]